MFSVCVFGGDDDDDDVVNGSKIFVATTAAVRLFLLCENIYIFLPILFVCISVTN